MNSIDDLEEKFIVAAERYMKKKLVDAAEEEFREQIELYKEIVSVVESVTKSKQLALSLWAKTKNNYTTAMSTYSTLKTTISSLYSNLQFLLRLIS